MKDIIVGNNSMFIVLFGYCLFGRYRNKILFKTYRKNESYLYRYYRGLERVGFSVRFFNLS